MVLCEMNRDYSLIKSDEWALENRDQCNRKREQCKSNKPIK